MKKSWRWLAALVTIALPISASASGLVDNVNGFTLNDKGKVERFDALLIDDRGKVEKLLKRKDKRQEKLDFRKDGRSEEHTSELQSIMRTSYAVFCLKKKQNRLRKHTL